MTRPLKIAHLSLSTLPSVVGGLEIVVDQLARRQVGMGHDVTIVTRWKQAKALSNTSAPYGALALPPFKAGGGKPFSAVPPRLPIEASIAFHQLRHRFDLFHIHWVYPTGWLAHRVLKKMGVPHIMTAHGGDVHFDSTSGHGYRQFARHDQRIRQFLPEIDKLVAISPSIAETLEQLGAPQANISKIPNGVDAKRIEDACARRRETRTKLGIGKSTRLILSVGRNAPVKGFDMIPGTLSRLRAEGHDVVWLVVGEGTSDLEDQFTRQGVSDHVRLLPAFRGNIDSGHFPPDELAEIYAAADIFAIPSRSEGFGLVILEAMAAQTPVVGFDVSGVRDVIDDGENGVLCEPMSEAAMAAAIGQLIDDDARATALAKSGLQKAMAFDWTNVAWKYQNLYEEMIAG